MRERKYMNPEVFNVELKEFEGEDCLVFEFPEDRTCVVNLNDSSGNQALKDAFSNILELLVSTDIELRLSIQNGYKRGLYIEVCKEYIEDLNREIRETREEIKRL